VNLDSLNVMHMVTQHRVSSRIDQRVGQEALVLSQFSAGPVPQWIDTHKTSTFARSDWI